MRQPNKVSGQAQNEGDNANRKVATATARAHLTQHETGTGPTPPTVEPQEPFPVNAADR